MEKKLQAKLKTQKKLKKRWINLAIKRLKCLQDKVNQIKSEAFGENIFKINNQGLITFIFI